MLNNWTFEQTHFFPCSKCCYYFDNLWRFPGKKLKKWAPFGILPLEDQEMSLRTESWKRCCKNQSENGGVILWQNLNPFAFIVILKKLNKSFLEKKSLFCRPRNSESSFFTYIYCYVQCIAYFPRSQDTRSVFSPDIMYKKIIIYCVHAMMHFKLPGFWHQVLFNLKNHHKAKRIDLIFGKTFRYSACLTRRARLSLKKDFYTIITILLCSSYRASIVTLILKNGPSFLTEPLRYSCS